MDIPDATTGLIPTPAWRNRVFRHHSNPYIDRPWTQGDNVNLAVGQGDVQVTPLQLARAYAALANGGTLVAPHVGGQHRRRAWPDCEGDQAAAAAPSPHLAGDPQRDPRGHAPGRRRGRQHLLSGHGHLPDPGRRQDGHGPGCARIDVEFALGEVRARVARPFGRQPCSSAQATSPASTSSIAHALGRARLTECAARPQELRFVLRLEREPDPSVQPRSWNAERRAPTCSATRVSRARTAGCGARARSTRRRDRRSSRRPARTSSPGGSADRLSVTRRLDMEAQGTGGGSSGLDGPAGRRRERPSPH